MKSTLFSSILLFLLIYLNFTSIAQEDVYQFGKIPAEEISLISCKFDKDADAIVLFDIGKAWFDLFEGKYHLIYERTCRIKILKESGNNHAHFVIPLYNHGEVQQKIIKLEGISWNSVNGEMMPVYLNEANFADDTRNPYWTNRRIEMPDVRQGTIIELHYTIRSSFLIVLNEWVFQSDIPTVYSSFEVKVIPYYKYISMLQGKKELISCKEFVDPGPERKMNGVAFSDKVYQYSMKDIPAFRESDFIDSERNYISKINIQMSEYKDWKGEMTGLPASWPDLISMLMDCEAFGKYIRQVESRAEKIINHDSITALDDTGKLNAIVSMIKKRYQWDSIYGPLATWSVSDLLQKKSGNIGNLNLLGVGLLKAVGLDAFPVILSTRNNGRIRYDYPFEHFFNYVVIGVRIDGDTILADGTEPLLPSYTLPVRCVNDRGLAVKKGKITWLDLSQSGLSEANYSITTDLSDTGLVSISFVSILAAGYEACRFKKECGRDLEGLSSSLRLKKYNVRKNDIRYADFFSYSEPFSIDYSATVENDISGDEIFIAPFLDEVSAINPMKDSVRTIPVDIIYPYKHNFESSVIIPAGFSATYLPAALVFNNENFSLTYNCMAEGNRITTRASYTYKNRLYPAELYLSLKQFNDIIIKKFNDRIVVTRQ
ncbi:MAG: hypothetical protein V1775_03140 [Bacteroidota bacterium]